MRALGGLGGFEWFFGVCGHFRGFWVFFWISSCVIGEFWAYLHAIWGLHGGIGCSGDFECFCGLFVLRGLGFFGRLLVVVGWICGVWGRFAVG